MEAGYAPMPPAVWQEICIEVRAPTSRWHSPVRVNQSARLTATNFAAIASSRDRAFLAPSRNESMLPAEITARLDSDLPARVHLVRPEERGSTQLVPAVFASIPSHPRPCRAKQSSARRFGMNSSTKFPVTRASLQWASTLVRPNVRPAKHIHIPSM